MGKILGIIFFICFWVGRIGAVVPVVPAIPDSVRIDTVEKRIQVIPIQNAFERDTLLPTVFPIQLSEEKVSPVYLPDSLIRDTLRYEYTRIKDFAYRNKWTKELYKMVFVNPRPGYLNVMRTQNSEERFKEYAGKIIHRIDVVVLPPYGTSVYDTAYYEEDMGWLKTLANKTHMRTAEKVLLRQLTIEPGMELVPFELVQNEILLRRLEYIDDATIMVSEVPDFPDRVNLTFICKDQLSWGGTVESNFLNSFEIGLENKNFMKLGHVVNYNFSYRGTKDKKWGNELEYKVNSLWGSHINIWGYYRNDYNEKKVLVEIERKFLTNRMKWAGGVGVGRIFYSDDLPDRNVNRLEELFNYHYEDVWLGRSFLLPSRYSYNQNMYLTGRFFTTIFHDRPIVSDDTNHLYYNRWDAFAAYTYTKIKYYKANLIYDFGRTEDIPTGLLFSVTAGCEKSEYDDFGYLASEFRYSHFNKEDERYYAFQAAIGSYINQDGFTRGVLKLGGSHISNLCSWGSYKFRFYNDINYLRGIRRYPGDYIYMEDADIRGFSSDSLRGNQKLSVSLATTFFLPYIKRGFRASVSAFCDFGVLAAENERLLRSKAYWGVGIGLNLRNDNVVIKNISFRLAYYPTLPVDGRSFQASMSGKNRGNFYDYHVTKPQPLLYE